MTRFIPAAALPALSALTQPMFSLQKPVRPHGAGAAHGQAALASGDTMALDGKPDEARVVLTAPQSGAHRAAESGACAHGENKQYADQNQQNLAAEHAYCQVNLSETRSQRAAHAQTEGWPQALALSPPNAKPLSSSSNWPATDQHRAPKRQGTRTLVGLALLALAALVAAPAQAQAVGPVSKLVVTQNGQGPADSGCASFRLSAKQAQAFFKRAVLITERQNHDHFDRGPCTVSGTFKTRFDSWEWEIRNGGTAAIMSSNGDSFLLADPRQASAPN